MTALAIIHKQEIIKRLASGERLSDIANSYNVSFQAISAPLVDDPEYKVAKMLSLDRRMELREDQLESAPDMLELARARELLSQARWRAQTEGREVWGKDTVNQQVNVNLNLSNSTLSRMSDLIPDTSNTIKQLNDSDDVSK